MAVVRRMKLGSQGLVVSAQGLGCSNLTRPPSKPDSDMIALLQHAIDSGVTFFDTSDIYSLHTNEILIGKRAWNWDCCLQSFRLGLLLCWVDSFPENDLRMSLPRFHPDNLEQNRSIFERVSEMAAKKGCTPAQLALAWVHHQGNDVCPVPGTTKIENLNQNIGALSVSLTTEEMLELESFASEDNIKGDRTQGIKFTWQEADTPPLASWKNE